MKKERVSRVVNVESRQNLVEAALAVSNNMKARDPTPTLCVTNLRAGINGNENMVGPRPFGKISRPGGPLRGGPLSKRCKGLASNRPRNPGRRNESK